MFIADVPLHCVNEAAYIYHVPASLIISVLNVEQGKTGMAIKNKNGTYDLGPMQINSRWKNILGQQGITLGQVQNDACLNVKVGTWILSKNIADGQGLLSGIGDYHSHTNGLNQHYAQQVRARYTMLHQILS